MKKFISLSLVLTMVLMLVSCGVLTGNKTEITRGKIEGNVYTNEVLNFKFTKPDSWMYYTDEEIAQSVNLSADMLKEDKFKDSLKDNASLFDMMVIDTLTGTNINMGYENLSKSFASNITVDQYIDVLKKQFADITAMTVVFPDKYETVKLGENEFTKVECKTTMNGLDFTQVYYIHKIDGYMCFFTVTIMNGYTVADIENMFK